MRSLQEEQSVNETIVETEAELLQQESNTRIHGFQESIHPQNAASYLHQDDIGQIQVRNKILCKCFKQIQTTSLYLNIN